MRKNEIRKKFKALRAKESPKKLAQKSLKIFERCRAEFDLEGKHISIFLPIERFQEINTWHFLEAIDAHFYLPVIRGENDLRHIKFESKEQIEESDWGIPEPTFGKSVTEDQLDLVLVPLLAIDQKGYRTGYGKGFYDRFLAKCRPDCLFIGLSYYDPIDRIEDLNSDDIPLHACVTPEHVLTF